ncbi:hypothetical protein FDECE_8525 [Fusarium decemcellulare]|nr:hypothetical protein FDECE_8525 [Fusarium decemcellulare]
MSLANLPPEVLSLILHHVDSPRSLYHFISASPASFRVFSQSRKRILSSVIKNALPGQSVQHALAVLQAPSVGYSQVHPFLAKYFGYTSSFDFPTNEAGLLQLYHLYNRISYLLDGYLKSVQELGFDESVLRPSLTERTRLQRAFLRFELYSRVFPRCGSDPYPPPGEPRPVSRHPASQQFELFLANLSPWEVEEMSCVEQYFSSLIDEAIDQVEEDLVRAVLAAPGVVLPSPASTSSSEAAEAVVAALNDRYDMLAFLPLSPSVSSSYSSSSSSEETAAAEEEEEEEEEEEDDDEREERATQKRFNQDNLCHFQNLDLTSLILFGRDGRYRSPDYVAYMSSLSLDFMYNLVKHESKRAELIRANHPVDREFLPQALTYSPTLSRVGEYDVSSANDTADDDDPSHSNLGYRLFRKTGQTGKVHLGIHLTGSSYSSLRQLGYVFWDADRILSPEVFEELSEAEIMSWDEIHLRFDRRMRPTAEDRLKGVMLPGPQMERIEQEFGSVHLRDDD